MRAASTRGASHDLRRREVRSIIQDDDSQRSLALFVTILLTIRFRQDATAGAAPPDDTRPRASS